MFGEVLDKAAEQTSKNNPQRTEDYVGENGLLYCGICKTPKQTRVSIFGEQKTVFCSCDCVKAAKQKQEEARKRQLIEECRFKAFPGLKHRTETFEADTDSTAEISKICRNYAKRFDPNDSKWLIFYGDVGTGKSFYAAAVCNSLIDQGYSVKFTSISTIIKELWNARDKLEYYDRLDRFDLIVLDDFDSERSTDYAKEIRFDVIEMRSNSGKPLIITSNMTAQDFKTEVIDDKRIYSRMSEYGLFIRFNGADKRKESLKQTMKQELDKLLNDG